ncbi:prion-like-(Q/N-rich) domain-bearing protein 25 isoform X1 [Cotesia glomerata]|uniref:prion-like-(Q/N-rich) domain-bearing protein 25 isoform X1 n=1 Tax=Cotesia glomerata TaxID=32391 RepID=UPI001D02971C|nr:prion-like-(Q/N-rich) domain-bearing protein 25 isoform X1 [Cotesia glomerata]
MMWTIIFMIFGLPQVYTIDSINQCADHLKQCNPILDLPCCEENNTCALIHWNDQNLYKCLKKMRLDEPCMFDSDCSDSESVICSPDEGVCKCSEKHLRVNDHKCASLLGNPCKENSDCAVLNSICHKNICKCKSSYYSSSNNICVLTALEKPCFSDDECWTTKNTVCADNGICACIGSYQEMNNAVCASFLQGYCKYYTDCWPDNSICIDNRCECKYGFQPITYKECQASPLEKLCIDDIDCNQISPGSKITGREYACKRHKSYGYNFRCSALLGHFCVLQRHCLINNSHCISNICQCEPGFVSKSKDECVPILLNKPCESNNDCDRESHLMCSNDKKCVCEQGYLEVNRTCAPTLGQSCSENYPCVATNSECFRNLCL